MTTAEPPAPRTPDADDARDGFNLAERIYGDASTNGTANGTHDEGAPTNGNGHSSNGGDGASAPPQYNLAAQVYGDESGTGAAAPTNGNGNGATAPEQYNLAARIYGNGNDNGATATAVAAPAAAPPNGAAPTAVAGYVEPPEQKKRFRTFESLGQSGFRWYMLAQLGSFGAMNMQQLVRAVIVFQLTGSYAALGTVALAQAIPGIALTMWGGLVADRYPKKLVVQIGQGVSAANALVVAILLFTDGLVFWHLLAASVVQGGVMAMMMPSRQAMMPEVVGMGRLMNATALSMGTMNLMRLVGPAAGGVLLAAYGGEAVYFVMVGFYIWSVVMLAKVPILSPEEVRASAPAGAPQGGRGGRGPGMRGGGRGRGGGGIKEIIAGLSYIRHNPTILTLLVTSLSIVIFSMPYQMMLPGYVIDVLKGGPETVGYLMSVTAIGSFVTTLVIASLPERNRGRLLLVGGFFSGFALLAFPMTTFWPVIIGVVIVVGAGQSLRMSVSNVLLQTYVEDEYRGRVMSVQMMQMNLSMFGTFVFGVLASIIGPQLTIGSMGAILLVIVTFATIFLPRLRRLQ
ncbi:MAG TPA: MFS transporter [Dehalococcoidia bacterium]|nr:MFS transporter [Dehalococcoidia bacterium]